MAPEMLHAPARALTVHAPSTRVTATADVWSVGVLTYEMLTGPLGGRVLAREAEAMGPDWRPRLPDDTEPFLTALLGKLLTVDSATRPDCSTLLKSPEMMALKRFVGVIEARNARPLSTLHQLPPVPRNFVGREEELARLRSVNPSKGVVLTGVRGMGGSE